MNDEELMLHLSNKGQHESLRVLLENGVNVNIVNNPIENITPLHMASNPETAVLLIAHGADLTAADGESGDTPLHYACSSGKTDVAEVLLKHDVDVDIKNNYGQTPLFKTKNKETAELLINSGAAVNIKSDWNDLYRTPLHHAQSDDIAKLLVEHGADIYSSDDNGCLPFHYALTVELVLYYLQCGIALDTRNKNNATVLHTNYQNKEVVRFLADQGLNINEQDNEGNTSLHLACTETPIHPSRWDFEDDTVIPVDMKLVQFYLENGADITVKNKEGKTPLDLLPDHLRKMLDD